MTAPTLAVVLGRTARALRGDHKTEALARAVTAAGLNWSTGHVAQLEAGRVSPTVPTLYALASAFSLLLDRPMTLANLFAGEGQVAIGAGAEVELSALREALRGQAVKPPDYDPAKMVAASIARLQAEVDTWPPPARVRFNRLTGDRHLQTVETFVEADLRVARSLDISRSRAIAEMADLWGRSLSAERDRQAGPDASQQKRGRISRELKKQLQEAIGGDDQ
jgi:hypothetical protein